jgi:hypothetical protein
MSESKWLEDHIERAHAAMYSEGANMTGQEVWWKTYWAALASTPDDHNRENAVQRARDIADITVDELWPGDGQDWSRGVAEDPGGNLKEAILSRMSDWNRSPEHDERHADEIIHLVRTLDRMKP